MLEEALSEDQIAELCGHLARMFKGLDSEASDTAGDNGASAVANGDSGALDEEYLVKCENIIMAFAGRVLLKKRQVEGMSCASVNIGSESPAWS